MMKNRTLNLCVAQKGKSFLYLCTTEMGKLLGTKEKLKLGQMFCTRWYTKNYKKDP